MIWYVEEGIGEERAIRVEGGTISAARIHWPGALVARQVEDALLISRASGSTRGTARFSNGEEALVDRLPRDAREGAPLRLTVARASISESGRTKLAHARPSTDAPCAAPSLAAMLRHEGHDVQIVRRFPEGGWDDLIADAFSHAITFAGGALHLSPTPAMTLIDVDGALPPRALSLAAIPAIAAAIARFDLAGSIGIDFPTLTEKADRRAVDDALSAALDNWPHERTAMNGFGFVQLVSRLERPSLLHRINCDPAAASARLLLRRAERTDDPGALLLTLHPAVKAAIVPQWETELSRRTGREIRWQCDPALALEAGFAQSVPL